MITAADASSERVQHPRLIRKPRTPPPPRRALPSAAPPIIDLPPAADVEEMSGGMCTDDISHKDASHSDGSAQEGATTAPFDAFVERVVNEVSRRVLERVASAPYMVGLVMYAARVWFLTHDTYPKHNLYKDTECSHQLCATTGSSHPRKDTQVWRPFVGSDDRKCCEPHFRGFRDSDLLKGFFFLGLVRLQSCKQMVHAKQTSTSATKTKLPKNGDIARPRMGGVRQQQDASASTAPKSIKCSVAHGWSCLWVI